MLVPRHQRGCQLGQPVAGLRAKIAIASSKNVNSAAFVHLLGPQQLATIHSASHSIAPVAAAIISIRATVELIAIPLKSPSSRSIIIM